MSGTKGHSGRKRKSLEVLRFTGAYREDRHGGRLAIPRPAKCPDPPKSLTGEALEEWHRVAPLLWREGLLISADTVALSLYCDSVADYIECTKQISELESPFIKNSKGVLRPHPLYRLQDQFSRQVLAMATKFGMTPAARAGIRPAPKHEQDNPRARFFNDPKGLIKASRLPRKDA